MHDANANVIRRYFDELFNRGRVDLIPELLHPDYANHSPGSPDLPRGRDGVAIVVEALRRGLPDLHYRIDDMIVDARAAAVRTTMTGTHEGELFGLAPTGRRIEVTQMTFEYFRDGRIIAHHRVTDERALFRQLAGE